MKIAKSKSTTRAGNNRPASPQLRRERDLLVESMAAPEWRLPGGIRLADYALRGGFVASSLLARGERNR